MNYIKEINAFHTQNLFEPISSSAVCLWFALMHFNNLCGWKKEFSVAASQLQAVSGLKPTAFKEARLELQRKGRIAVSSRSGNQAAMYQMISQQMEFYKEDDLEESENNSEYLHIQQDNAQNMVPYEEESVQTRDLIADHKPDHTSGHSSDHKAGRNPGSFFKQDNTKQKQNKTTAAAAEAIAFLEDNFKGSSPFICKSIENCVGEMSEPLVLHAMELALEQGIAKWRYVKGILQAWKVKGITTVAEANSEEKTYQANCPGKQAGSSFQQKHAEIIPDWFIKQKQREQERKGQEELNRLMIDPVAEAEEIRELLAGLRT